MADDIKIVGLANTKNSGKTNWKVVGAIIGIIVLSIGIIAGILLVRQNQDIREQAACKAQCPSDDNVLMSCHDDAESSGGDTLDSICNASKIGRIEVCGQTQENAKQYCCTSNGWKTNLTLCSVSSTATPTATATATPTATAMTTVTASATATATNTASPSSTKTATPTSTSKATKTPTSTATAKATATSTASAFPVPETGADWPTMLGAGFGAIMILVSLALAL